MVKEATDMENKITDLNEICSMINHFWGYKVNLVIPYPKQKKVVARLYDAFEFKFDFINERYEDLFHASLLCPDNAIIDRLLGVNTWKSPTKENIISILEAVDRYCRLRLPDKYLEAFDEAYANK